MKNPNLFRNIFYYIFDKKNQFFVKLINFILLFFIIFILLFLKKSYTGLNYRIDDIPKKDIIAKEDFYYVDKEWSTIRKNQIIDSTPPIYVYNNEIVKNKEEQLKNYLQILLKSNNFDSLQEIENNVNLNLSNEEYINFKKIRNKKLYIDLIISLFNNIYKNSGIVNIEDERYSKLESSGIKIKKDEEEILYSIESVDTYDTVISDLLNDIDLYFSNYDNNQKKIAFKILKKFLKPNVFYDKDLSEIRLNNRLEAEPIKQKRIESGTVLASRDKKIDKKEMELIKAYDEHLKNKNKQFSLKFIASSSMLLIFIISLMYYFINRFLKESSNDFKNYIFLSLFLFLIAFYLFILIILDVVDENNIYLGIYLPISAISLAFLFLYSRLFSVFFTTISAILFYYISGFNTFSFIFVFSSGTLSLFFINKITKRINLLKAGIYISVINIFLSIFIFLNSSSIYYEDLLKIILSAIINGVLSSLLAIGIIFLGENILNTPTVFRLQELAHFSSPLLKSLFNSAIGTYNHSIIVGNLAEAAALEIGANDLLAKVGGYYHDIGKLDNPEYFIENQGDFNKHDTLKPSISTSIIKAHVKNGIIKAKKARLPKKVIDIIEQHHGNTLIRYFYEEAIKTSSPDKEEILKIDYHYQNKNPEFPESAIVLLADQVEAATRSLKKYTMTTIEKIIEKLVDDNFQNGILDDSGLTLKDITKIKKIFSKLIVGMYHPRIEYPTSDLNTEKDKNNNKKVLHK